MVLKVVPERSAGCSSTCAWVWRSMNSHGAEWDQELAFKNDTGRSKELERPV